VRDALAVTRWDRASDPTWLASRRIACGWPAPTLAGRSELLCAPEPDAFLQTSALRVARLCGTGPTRLPAWNALRALTVVEGEIELGQGADSLVVAAGCTVAVPAASGALEASLRGAHALVAAAVCSRDT
jgi:hypothetical protein